MEEESKAQHRELGQLHLQYFPESVTSLRVLIVRKPRNTVAHKMFQQALE